MKLPGQLLLAVLGTTLLCGGAGTFVLGRRAAQGAAELLDGELRIGESALQRQWLLRRAERRSAYLAVTRQSYFRAYLLVGDRAQMSYYAGELRRAGAHSALILSAEGELLAGEGEHAAALREAVRGAPLGADGALMAVGGTLMDVLRFPIGKEATAGHVVVANRVDQGALRGDAEPFGVEAALAAGGALVSTLPAEVSAQALRGLLADTGERREIGGRRERYRVRVASFGGGHLLVAVPLRRVGGLTTELVILVSGLLVLILLVAGGGALLVLDRVIKPMAHLELAARRMGEGDLAGAGEALHPFAARKDEVGVVARTFHAAVHEMALVVLSSGAVSQALSEALAALDRSAALVAEGAARQEQRLLEVEKTVGPLTTSLEVSAAGLSDAQGSALALRMALASAERVALLLERGLARIGESVISAEAVLAGDRTSAGQRAQRMMGELAQDIGASTALLGEQREGLRRLGELVVGLRRRLDGALGTQIHERDRGVQVHRAIAEIGRVANSQVNESSALRKVADVLRSDVDRLNQALTFWDARARPR